MFIHYTRRFGTWLHVPFQMEYFYDVCCVFGVLRSSSVRPAAADSGVADLAEFRPPLVTFQNRVSSTFYRTLLVRVWPVARPVLTQGSTIQKDAKKHPFLERNSNPRYQYFSGPDPQPRPRGLCDQHGKYKYNESCVIIRQQITRIFY
jgi:hypothetical protein